MEYYFHYKVTLVCSLSFIYVYFTILQLSLLIKSNILWINYEKSINFSHIRYKLQPHLQIQIVKY